MTAITRLSLAAVPGSAILAGGVNHTNVYLAAHSDPGFGGVAWGEQPWHNYNWFDLAHPAGSFLETDTDVRLYNQNLRQLFSDDDAVLYLPADGSDGQTAINDHSEQEHTITPAGGFQLSNTQTKFNLATSGKFSSGLDILTISDHDDFNFASGDFTIDFWAYYNNAPAGSEQFYLQKVDSNNYISLSITTILVPSLKFSVVESGIAKVNLDLQISINTGQWYHIAVTRSGNVFRLFLDGALLGSVTQAHTIADFAASVTLNGNLAGPSDFNGYLADLRILKGRAAWTGAFTPPTNAHGSAYVRQWQVAFADVAACGEQGALSDTTVFEVDAAGQLVIAVGNVTYGLRANRLTGGTFRASWLYNARQQPATPTGFKIYRKLNGAFVLLGTRKYRAGGGRYSWLSGTFSHGDVLEVLVRTYRTVNGIDHEENNENIVTITADAQGPPAIETVTATT